MSLEENEEPRMLFVKRDMFNDSGFPHTVMPATKEALIAFIAETHLKENSFEALKHFDIKIEEYHMDLLVVIYYKDKSHGHWVLGFVRDGRPADMELPFEQSFGPDDASLAEGYSTRVLRPATGERGDNPLHFWSKEEA